jgi:hypothetical protein
MKRFAINIVMLPPDPVMDLAIEWNKMFCDTEPGKIVLNKKDRLPHISLVMGCLRADLFEQAQGILQSVAAQHEAINLQISHTRIVKGGSGDSIISFDIEPSRNLINLHESLVDSFKPLLSQNATEADIYDMPPIETSTLDWINRYIPHNCFDHFWPHITVGFGESPVDFKPISFQASRMAICHLGNHCTCRKVLAEKFLQL